MTTGSNRGSREGWTARTWFAMAVTCWLAYGVMTVAGAQAIATLFVLLSIACLVGFVWRLLDGR